jgi:hypothetical protein
MPAISSSVNARMLAVLLVSSPASPIGDIRFWQAFASQLTCELKVILGIFTSKNPLGNFNFVHYAFCINAQKMASCIAVFSSILVIAFLSVLRVRSERIGIPS